MDFRFLIVHFIHDWILRHFLSVTQPKRNTTSTLTRDTDAPGEKALAEAKNKAEKATENFILCTINTLIINQMMYVREWYKRCVYRVEGI